MSAEDAAESAETQQLAARPLHLLTTDVLLADLISSRVIATDEGHSFALNDIAARSVLNWYRNNRPKWAGKVMTSDCEAIVAIVDKEPPQLPAPSLSNVHVRKVLRLSKVAAHRFAGLHAYGDVNDAPEDFSFEPEKPITLFEGWNGSGKTSLANAVIWCLTGQLLRAQRLPESGEQEFACHIDRDTAESSAHQITPVTPLPNDTIWRPEATAKAVPADTWVELTFVDEDGCALPPIRRTQSRKPNGKLVENVTSLSTLGIDPIGFRLGTTMPGMLPFLQVGNTSELGIAVAKLTGLADLVALAKHATNAEKRISKEITADREKELDRIVAEFNQHRTDLEQRMTEFPAMKPEADLPKITNENADERIEALITHFEKLKADGLAHAKEVLGNVFDAEDATQRKDLEGCIGPAIEQSKKLRQLPSIDRLAKLKLEEREKAAISEMLTMLRREADILAELAANPTLARRTQLYARVTAWMTEHDHAHDGSCAVCRGSLSGVIDPETGTPVADHLKQVAEDSEIVSKTIVQWAMSWTGILSRDLPAAVRGEVEHDLPSTPSELLRIALVDELFKTEPFMGVLAALKPGVESRAKKALDDLPPFGEPAATALPEQVHVQAAKLVVMLQRIERALAFIEWIGEHREALLKALEVIRSGVADADNGPDAESNAASSTAMQGINLQLARLDFIVKGVAPITAASGLADRMAKTLTARERQVTEINACATAAAALKAIAPIGSLAQAQVEGLRTQLHDRAEYWRDQIYQNATTFSPKPQRTGMNAQGVIEIHVGRGGVRAPAQHVSNASALRASLMGFYLAFREHVMKTSGGLSLLVLDDPQELLDYDNRQRLARAITRLADDGAQILTTTHDRSFARTLIAEGRSDDRIAHHSVHPVNASRRTLKTSLAVEELDRKRQAFISNIDSAPHAQDYANEARIFLEARLGDLFDDPAYPAYSTTSKAPTLIPLFDRLRGLVAARSNELFKSLLLSKFCNDPGMADGAEPRRILNQSHHDKASISYADVQKIDGDLKRLRTSMERVHEEFRRFRWREPLAKESPSNVVLLNAVKPPEFDVPVCQDIAAFTGHVPSGGSQDDSGEILSSSWFDDKALFYVRHDTMGFAIPAGSVAIVEVEASLARDHSLVIARRGSQLYARRLLRPRNGEGFSLSAEATDARRSRPTLAFEDHGIEVYRVVGALFSHLPPPAGREEAAEINSDPALAQVEVAYRVREESAVPLALPGQTILGGRVLSPAELDRMEGTIVALTLEDGSSILKRIGTRISTAMPYLHLRQFETIGGLGDSVVIATEQVEGTFDMPVMIYARLVIGVIYDF